jgi:hypothetical protein
MPLSAIKVPLAYPNPVTNGRFFIDVSNMQGQEVEIELYDVIGKKYLPGF